MENNNWKLGAALEYFMQQLQEKGTDGVEAELKRIREATFERMRNHVPVTLTWKQIYETIENGKKKDLTQRLLLWYT